MRWMWAFNASDDIQPFLNARVRHAARDRRRSVVIERQGRLAAEVAGLGGRMKRPPHETPAARNARHATLL